MNDNMPRKSARAMDKQQLKPCPFCGGAAAFDQIPGAGQYIECRSCKASTNMRYATGDDPVPLLVEQWNRREPQPHSASDARECCNGDCGWIGTTDRMLGAVGPLCPECGEVTEALVHSPGVDADEPTRAALKETQSLLVGMRTEIETQIRDNRAALDAAPSPAASAIKRDATKHRTLQEQIRDAKAEVAAWEPDRREAVLMQGPRDDHPPSRDCMCATCRPSFDNGADDPAQRYDITRGGANG